MLGSANSKPWIWARDVAGSVRPPTLLHPMPPGPALLLCRCERRSRISYRGKGQDRFSPTHATTASSAALPRYGNSRSSHPWSWLTHAPPPGPALLWYHGLVRVQLSCSQALRASFFPHCPGEGQDQYSRVTSAREGRGQLCSSQLCGPWTWPQAVAQIRDIPVAFGGLMGHRHRLRLPAVAARPGPRHGSGWQHGSEHLDGLRRQHRLFLATPRNSSSASLHSTQAIPPVFLHHTLYLFIVVASPVSFMPSPVHVT